MNNHALEVLHIGGEKLMNVVRKEFVKDFFIVARTPEYIVIGDDIKNVKISRSNNRVQERHVFEHISALERKR